jgi:hypothetical protein
MTEIGRYVSTHGHTYKVVEATNGCEGCGFQYSSMDCLASCRYLGTCYGKSRDDGKDIIFQEIKQS